MWVFALRFTNRGLGFIRTIILARLLAPEDFGLLGIAMLAIATLETFSQTGFQAALIQKKENVDSYLDTAWTVSVVRGVPLVEDWGELLKDNAASSAILDRLLHRGHLFKFEGKSYRLKEAAEKLAIGRKKE